MIQYKNQIILILTILKYIFYRIKFMTIKTVSFIPLPSSIQMAILLPTVRWTTMARSVIATLVGIANSEVAVLIADNSENPEKHEFLKKIQTLNPFIFIVTHEKNIGAFANILYLYDWCKNIPFCALMADDDWMSPTYYTDAFELLRHYPQLTGAEVGNTLVDMQGDGQFQTISQHTMQGQTPLERIEKWNGTLLRVTMYNASARAALEPALTFYRNTPMNGYMLVEDLWELSRLATGEFVSQRGSGCFIHYPTHEARTGNSTERLYRLLHQEAGLSFEFIYFSALSTAVQCAIFLLGNLSPIEHNEQRQFCAQQVFRHIFLDSFLPLFASDYGRQTVLSLFAHHEKAMAGFLKFCQPPFSNNPVFDESIITWLIDVIEVFENQTMPLLSEQFRAFVSSVLD